VFLDSRAELKKIVIPQRLFVGIWIKKPLSTNCGGSMRSQALSETKIRVQAKLKDIAERWNCTQMSETHLFVRQTLFVTP
jgi:hypothetical protein